MLIYTAAIQFLQPPPSTVVPFAMTDAQCATVTDFMDQATEFAQSSEMFATSHVTIATKVYQLMPDGTLELLQCETKLIPPAQPTDCPYQICYVMGAKGLAMTVTARDESSAIAAFWNQMIEIWQTPQEELEEDGMQVMQVTRLETAVWM